METPTIAVLDVRGLSASFIANAVGASAEHFVLVGTVSEACTALQQVPGMVLVAAAQTPYAAWRESIAAIRAHCPHTPLGTYDSPPAITIIQELLELGILGYILADPPSEAFNSMLDALSRAEVYLDPRLSGRRGLLSAVQRGHRFVLPLEICGDRGSEQYRTAVAWIRNELQLAERDAELALAIHDGFAVKEGAATIGMNAGNAAKRLQSVHEEFRCLGVTSQASFAVLVEQALTRMPSGWQPRCSTWHRRPKQ